MSFATDEARTDQIAANFSNLSDADRAQFEKAFWKILAIPDPKAYVSPEKPSRKWYLADPPMLEISEPGYLCDICRHVDFRYLINAPLEQLLEEFTLFNLKWVVESGESCGFCRLILKTIKKLLKGRELVTEVEGRDVMCNFRTLPMEADFTGRGDICLLLQPSPEGIDSGILFSEFSPGRTTTDHRGFSIRCPVIDFELVKKWYHHCLTGQCGSNPTVIQEKNMPEGFRLIDVMNNCIVDFHHEYDYVALSYVWGGVATLQNKKAIRKELTKAGALTRRSHKLPNTIKDAIELTDNLGERYLWVDSLCIIQDDDEDKALQIAAMDLIYSSAILTIAAASGASADTGLPGMSARPRDFERHIEKAQGVYLANRPTIFSNAVNDSTWNSRAWTLQERVVSTRVLYVGAQRCFFTCQHRQDDFLESEDPIENGLERTNRPKRLKELNVHLIPTSQSLNIMVYCRVVQSYTLRHLTFPSDILNAFKAIEARLHSLFRSDFVFGLPRSELDSQLLWQPAGPMKRRRDPKTNLPLFPSWSWAGWVGEVSCNTKENLSRIEWVEADGKRCSGKDYRYPAGVNADVFKRLAYRVTWRGSLHSGVPYYMEKAKPESYFFHPTAPEDERRQGPNLKLGTDYLVFEAEINEDTDAFQIGGHYETWALYRNKCTKDTHVVCPLVIRDADGDVAGYVKVPGEITMQLSSTKSYKLVNISRTKKYEQEGRGEGNPDLLVDADDVTMEKQSFPGRPDVETANDSSACDQRRFDTEKPWCLYNVMLVEWVDLIAYRVGVGTVHIDAWARAKPRKTVITLG
ncbi:MAG: hypothetical protein L6R40_007577 [Gallowayella cf. fulva]|nr:MAG: hypothetical protein L6R40_007577 [Xanthomendoza cf. fulva]